MTKEKKTDYSTLDGMTEEQLRSHAVALKQVLNGIDEDIKTSQEKRKPHAAELAATVGRLNSKMIASDALDKKE